jgi:hypothetical protein
VFIMSAYYVLFTFTASLCSVFVVFINAFGETDGSFDVLDQCAYSLSFSWPHDSCQ